MMHMNCKRLQLAPVTVSFFALCFVTLASAIGASPLLHSAKSIAIVTAADNTKRVYALSPGIFLAMSSKDVLWSAQGEQ